MMKELSHHFSRIVLLCLTALSAHAATLSKGPRVHVSTNLENFDLSVFPGAAGYNDRGVGGSPSFTNAFGDGTVVDYNFIGNNGTGSALTTYASGAAGLIPTPTSPPANVLASVKTG